MTNGRRLEAWDGEKDGESGDGDGDGGERLAEGVGGKHVPPESCHLDPQSI